MHKASFSPKKFVSWHLHGDAIRLWIGCFDKLIILLFNVAKQLVEK